MLANTAQLVRLLQLEPLGQDRFLGLHPETSMQRTYGGQVLAQSLMAAAATAPQGFLVHSLHAYFLLPGAADSDLELEVSRLRDGRSFCTRRVDVTQHGRQIFTMDASCHRPEQGLEHGDPMPTVPAPEDCPRFVDVMDARFGGPTAWHEWEALDVRFIGDSGADGSIIDSGHPAHMQVWARTEGALPDDPVLHQAVLAYLSDLTLLNVSTVPHRVDLSRSLHLTASLDHAMWFHRPHRADQWLLYDMISPSASGALGFSFGRLFQDGRLVASAAQEGLIRTGQDAAGFPTEFGGGTSLKA